MKKNVIIGMLSCLLVFCLFYANIKATEAKKQRIQAELLRKQVVEWEQEAKDAKNEALKAAAEARRAEQMAIMEKESAEEAKAIAESLKKKLAQRNK